MTSSMFFIFFFNDTATTEIYTLSLHDALPICRFGAEAIDERLHLRATALLLFRLRVELLLFGGPQLERSEEHTSELQSHSDLVCRLLLEKKTMNTLC